ncbi:MAG: hypothetical protein ACRDOJ_03545 [Nocardioidaceae bacterium]
MTTPRRIAEPAALEEAGRKLATEVVDRLGGKQPTAVACWENADDAVLAHVVARELGVPVWHALEVEGLVSLDRDLDDEPAAVLVLESLQAASDIAGLAGVVANNGGQIVAVASATGNGATTGTEAEAAPVVRGAHER